MIKNILFSPCNYLNIICNSRSVGSLDACFYAEIRTRIPDTISGDYNFQHAGNTPVSFTVKVCSVLALFL